MFLDVVFLSELGEEDVAILKALSELAEASGCKAIGEKAGIEWRKVMAKLRGLKKNGYVESPVKGKYVISEKGRVTIK